MRRCAKHAMCTCVKDDRIKELENDVDTLNKMIDKLLLETHQLKLQLGDKNADQNNHTESH